MVPGPVTFLALSRFGPGAPGTRTPLDLLDALLPVYEELLGALAARGVAWVQVDEPCLVLDLDERAADACRVALRRLASCKNRPRLMVATYFGSVEHNLPLFAESGIDGLHVDLARAPGQLDGVLKGLPAHALLSLGVVDGRNIWRTDLDAAHGLVRRVRQELGSERLLVAPSCSLLHTPIDLAAEDGIDPELRGWLAFASQKIAEVRALADAAEDDAPSGPLFEEARAALSRRRASPRTRDPEVRKRAAAVGEAMLRRTSPFERRIVEQKARFGLPLLPTTTIGSFPQTAEIREARAKRRKGLMSGRSTIASFATRRGDAYRPRSGWGSTSWSTASSSATTWSKYFGERLAGYAFTGHGWVQSYGSRCVEAAHHLRRRLSSAPMTVAGRGLRPVADDEAHEGDAHRPGDDAAVVASPGTTSPRDDDLPARSRSRCGTRWPTWKPPGSPSIQVDEPAFREGLPLRRPNRAIPAMGGRCFRLATAGVRDNTADPYPPVLSAISNDILDCIVEMDADAISIETARSDMELLEAFAAFEYPNEIGPGVWDIHSPRVPSAEEMAALIAKAAEVLPPERLWVNPIAASRRAAGRKSRHRSRTWWKPRAGRGAVRDRLPAGKTDPNRDRHGLPDRASGLKEGAGSRCRPNPRLSRALPRSSALSCAWGSPPSAVRP